MSWVSEPFIRFDPVRASFVTNRMCCVQLNIAQTH